MIERIDEHGGPCFKQKADELFNVEYLWTFAMEIKAIWRQIFEGNCSVSPYFLHHYQDNNEAEMLSVDNLSLKILGAYKFFIFWPKM